MLNKRVQDDYDKVYDKAKISLKRTIKYLHQTSMGGGFLDLNRIYTMNSIMLYLKLINESTFEYYYIPKLDEISNTLNKI